MAEPKFKLIQEAKQTEQEAYEIYIALKEKVKEENSKMFCEELAREELRHLKLLEELGSQNLIELMENCERTGGFRLDIVTHFDKPVSSYELEELFKFAIKKEAEAVKRYSYLAEIASSPVLKNFFENLVAMESKHATMVGTEFERYKQRKNSNFPM